MMHNSIYQMAVESVIEIEADELLDELEEQHNREQNQNQMANRWRTGANKEINFIKELEAIDPARGPRRKSTTQLQPELEKFQKFRKFLEVF